MLRAVVYTRVSTDSQEKDGTSLETQERACVQQVDASGWHLTECIRDTASGFTLDRTGIEQVRQLLRKGGVEVVVAYAVDRLSRNQNHIGVLFDEVERAGARLEIVTERFEDTAMGRFILAARAFIAEVEREKIVERTIRLLCGAPPAALSRRSSRWWAISPHRIPSDGVGVPSERFKLWLIQPTPPQKKLTVRR